MRINKTYFKGKRHVHVEACWDVVLASVCSVELALPSVLLGNPKLSSGAKALSRACRVEETTRSSALALEPRKV